jgi:hypothetical protein
LFLKGPICAYSDNGLCFFEGREAGAEAAGAAPLFLEVEDMEERDCVAETVLDVDITEGEGNQKELEFVGRGGESEEKCEHIVHSGIGIYNDLLGRHDDGYLQSRYETKSVLDCYFS